MKTNRSHNAHFLCFDGLNPLQDKHGIKTIHFGGGWEPFRGEDCAVYNEGGTVL